MTQTVTVESFSESDPAVLAWQQAFTEAARTVPEAIETVARKLGSVLLGDQAA